MKIRHFIITAFAAASVLMFSSSLFAFGLGLYGTGAKGTADWTYEDQEYPYGEYDVKSDVSKIGGGFILDSNLAYDRLFNYRLHIGYSKIKIDNDTGSDIKGWDYHCYNSFGFGVFRSEPVRIWLGPQIGFGFIDGEYDNDLYNDTNEFGTVFFALGIIAGVNFNMGDVFTLAIDGGYRYSWHGGWATMANTSGTIDQDYDVTGKMKEAFVDVSVIFRIGGDVF
ncbi:MAG: hypothetical protein V1874_16840 [Spirochaetota bacterium]